MAENYIVTYDLDRPVPTHAAMDMYIRALAPACVVVGRILETVWFIKYSGTEVQLRDYLKRILGPNDRLLVVRADRSAWKELLVPDLRFKQAFEA